MSIEPLSPCDAPISQSNSGSEQTSHPCPPTENPHAAHGRLAAGRKTPAGLANSSRNATKHGLSAKYFCLLQNEDPALFEQHRASFQATLAPRNAVEQYEVNRIIESTWLLNRITCLETIALHVETGIQRADAGQQHLDRFGTPYPEAGLTYRAFEAIMQRGGTLDTFHRFRVSFERTVQRSLSTLEKLRKGALQLPDTTCNEPIAESTQHLTSHFLDSVPPPAPPYQEPKQELKPEQNTLPNPPIPSVPAPPSEAPPRLPSFVENLLTQARTQNCKTKPHPSKPSRE